MFSGTDYIMEPGVFNQLKRYTITHHLTTSWSQACSINSRGTQSLIILLHHGARRIQSTQEVHNHSSSYYIMEPGVFNQLKRYTITHHLTTSWSQEYSINSRGTQSLVILLHHGARRIQSTQEVHNHSSSYYIMEPGVFNQLKRYTITHHLTISWSQAYSINSRGTQSLIILLHHGARRIQPTQEVHNHSSSYYIMEPGVFNQLKRYTITHHLTTSWSHAYSTNSRGTQSLIILLHHGARRIQPTQEVHNHSSSYYIMEPGVFNQLKRYTITHHLTTSWSQAYSINSRGTQSLIILLHHGARRIQSTQEVHNHSSSYYIMEPCVFNQLKRYTITHHLTTSWSQAYSTNSRGTQSLFILLHHGARRIQPTQEVHNHSSTYYIMEPGVFNQLKRYTITHHLTTSWSQAYSINSRGTQSLIILLHHGAMRIQPTQEVHNHSSSYYIMEPGVFNLLKRYTITHHLTTSWSQAYSINSRGTQSLIILLHHGARRIQPTQEVHNHSSSYYIMEPGVFNQLKRYTITHHLTTSWSQAYSTNSRGTQSLFILLHHGARRIQPTQEVHNHSSSYYIMEPGVFNQLKRYTITLHLTTSWSQAYSINSRGTQSLIILLTI